MAVKEMKCFSCFRSSDIFFYSKWSKMYKINIGRTQVKLCIDLRVCSDSDKGGTVYSYHLHHASTIGKCFVKHHNNVYDS